jgi:hypothetical protein
MYSDDVKKMLEAQVKTCTYIDERRDQMKTVGVGFDGFITELNNAFKDEGVTYQNATAAQKRGMQEVYATKKLMDEQLKSKSGSGLIGWIKRIWYRKDISAINRYLNAANAALGKANFNEAAAKEADEAMTKNGCFHGEYKASDAEKTLEEKMQKKPLPKSASNAGKTVEQKKLPESAITDISKMPIKDQLLQLGFRPSKSSAKKINEQIEAYREVKAHIDANEENIPEDVKLVFKANEKKLQQVKKCFPNATRPSRLHEADRICEEIEAKTMQQVSPDEYKPVSFEELKKATSVKIPIMIDLTAGDKNIEVSKPVETDEKVLNKENPIISN